MDQWSMDIADQMLWGMQAVLSTKWILVRRSSKSYMYLNQQHHLSVHQSLSRVWLFVTPWTAACQPSLSITNSQSLLKVMSIESVMPYNHLILCRSLFLPPSIFPSIRVFSTQSVLSTSVQSVILTLIPSIWVCSCKNSHELFTLLWPNNNPKQADL